MKRSGKERLRRWRREKWAFELLENITTAPNECQRCGKKNSRVCRQRHGACRSKCAQQHPMPRARTLPVRKGVRLVKCSHSRARRSWYAKRYCYRTETAYSPPHGTRQLLLSEPARPTRWAGGKAGSGGSAVVNWVAGGVRGLRRDAVGCVQVQLLGGRREVTTKIECVVEGGYERQVVNRWSNHGMRQRNRGRQAPALGSRVSVGAWWGSKPYVNHSVGVGRLVPARRWNGMRHAAAPRMA